MLVGIATGRIHGSEALHTAETASQSVHVGMYYCSGDGSYGRAMFAECFAMLFGLQIEFDPRSLRPHVTLVRGDLISSLITTCQVPHDRHVSCQTCEYSSVTLALPRKLKAI